MWAEGLHRSSAPGALRLRPKQTRPPPRDSPGDRGRRFPTAPEQAGAGGGWVISGGHQPSEGLVPARKRCRFLSSFVVASLQAPTAPPAAPALPEHSLGCLRGRQRTCDTPKGGPGLGRVDAAPTSLGKVPAPRAEGPCLGLGGDWLQCQPERCLRHKGCGSGSVWHHHSSHGMRDLCVCRQCPLLLLLEALAPHPALGRD